MSSFQKKMKNDIDLAKDRKKELASQFVKQMRQRIESQPEVPVPVVDGNVDGDNYYRDLYKKLKKDHETLRKRSEQDRDELKGLRREQQRCRDQVKEAKAELHLVRKSCMDEVSSMKEKVTQCENELLELQGSVKNLSKELDDSNESKKYLRRQLHSQKLTIEGQKASIRYYEREMVTQSLHKKIALLKRQLDSANRHVKKMRNGVKQYEALTITTMLDIAFDRMTLANIGEYCRISDLNRKYKRLIRNLMMESNEDSTIIEEELVRTELGYVTRDGEAEWTFVNLTGNTYSVSSIIDDVYLSEGMIVAAKMIGNGQAYVYQTYRDQSVSSLSRKSQAIVRKELVKKEDESYAFIGDQRVLLLTANDGNKYVSRLKKHGLDAEWVDPYEKNPKHIREMMKGFDVVLLMRDSMPHAMLDIVDDENDPKYQFMFHHNEDLVADRVRFALVQLIHAPLSKQASGI